jgi:hypothetical protein
LKSGYFSRNLPMKRLFTALSVLASVGALGCASAGPGAGGGQADQENLTAFAQRAVQVLPLQEVFEQPGGAISHSASALAFRENVDNDIRFSFGEAPPPRWSFAQAIIASSQRNLGVSADPLKLSVEGLSEKLPEPEDAVSETLRTQIRQIVALTDARYILLPVFVRTTEGRQAGVRRATMRVVLIDARLARVRWAEDISTDFSGPLGRSVSATLAGRLAQMAGAR